MKTSTVVIILVIVALAGGGVYFFSQQQSKTTDSMMQDPSAVSGQDKMEDKDSMMKDESGDAMMEKEGAMMNDGSRYIVYENGVLDKATDKKRVVFFYANWCPTCKPANESFTANANKIPEDVVLIRVNYNDPDTDAEEKALAQKYGVTYQHTFVQIDEQGNVVKKWNGGQIDELLANIQ